MAAVWMRVRSELRARLGAILVLALIAGTLGGIVIAAAAGAQRTDTAYPRFLADENALDLEIDANAKTRAGAERVLAKIARLPQVRLSAEVDIASGTFDLPHVRQSGTGFSGVFPLVSPTGGLATRVNKLKILQGRMFDPSAPDEIVPSFVIADQLHMHVGQTVRFKYGSPFGDPLPLAKSPPPPVELHVVGIAAAPSMFKPLEGNTLPGVMLTPAFARAHPEYIGFRDLGIIVVLRHGAADVKAVTKEIQDLRTSTPDARPHIGFNAHQQTIGIQQSTHVQAIALWALAALVALAGIAVFGQALARQTFIESLEYPTLRSVGMTPSQLLGVGMIRAATIGVLGAAVAVLVAYLLSTFTPTGVARIAEPNPGFAFNGAVFGLGAAAVVVIVAAIGGIPAWLASVAGGSALGTITPRGRSRSSAVGSFARSTLPPSAATGVRMALDPGRGRTAVPVRTAMFGAALSLLALSAAVGFGASLNHLVDTPRLAGANWDAIMFVRTTRGTQLEHALDTDRDVQGYALGTITNLQVDGVGATAIAMRSVRGGVTPSVVDGHLPHGLHEVMLGSETMGQLGVDLGDTIRVTGKEDTLRMRVVGKVAVPSFFFSFSRPGKGMAVSLAAIRRIQPGSLSQGVGAFVRYADGVATAKAEAAIRRRVQHVFILGTETSGSVRNLSGVGSVPLLLAGILAAMAAMTLAHTLITSIRRRRLDLAILKTLGFVRHQVSAAVAWQATTLGAVAVAIGLPLGVVAGRWGWNVFADRLGVVREPVIPFATVLIAIPATLLVANLLAVIPGRIASRLKAAPVLRAE